MELGENNTIAQDASIDPVVLEQTSGPFVGRWNRLVSNTNWEKGRIIYQWREALIASGAPVGQYSDEAWSVRVGGVTGQHVGRLRRVYQRFGQTYEQFDGLFWSHFQAAVDWEDAEMWLEGAVQNGWSVAQMRTKRWETMGAVDADRPDARDVVASELDEDFEPAINEAPQRTVAENVAAGPLAEGPDFGDETSDHESVAPAEDLLPAAAHSNADSAAQAVRPFEQLGEFPDDLAEAFDAFKLAILRHKLDGWQDVSCEHVLAGLDALKQLATAPSE